jgi:hypothetical protein
MNTVQIQLKSRDSRISGFHLNLKIVYEFQLRSLQDVFRREGNPTKYWPDGLYTQ